MMKPGDPFYIQSINRALALVETISKSGNLGLRISEITQPDLPMSTAYRILRNLVAWQYVAEREDGRYVLGAELARLGELASASSHLVDLARKHLEALARQSGQTVYMAMLDEAAGNLYYVDKIRSQGEIQLSAGIGSRNLVHSTANGKMLISQYSDDQIYELLERTGMKALTGSTRTTPEAFLADVEQARRRGYAISLEENEKGVVCVSAPILDRAGRIVAAVSASGVKGVTMSQDCEKEIGLVTETAKTISGLLSFPI